MNRSLGNEKQGPCSEPGRDIGERGGGGDRKRAQAECDSRVFR
jgi:hypothetical protein